MPRWRKALRAASLSLAVLAASLPLRAGIPYAQGTYFASGPFGAATLPPLPDALKPMGPPKPAPNSIVSPLPPAVGPKNGPGSGPTTTGLPSESAGGTTINGVPMGDGEGAPSRGETTVTTSNAGFLDWIRQNQDAAALARAARSRYNQAPPSPSEAATDNNDLMLNVRYPYLWNQDQPPGGGAAIYTIQR